jgi:serine/threonine-protein kinase
MIDLLPSTHAHHTFRDTLWVLLERFEVAWCEGDAPRIDEYLVELGSAGPDPEPSSRCALLEELIKIDLEYRWRRAGISSNIGVETSGPCGLLPLRPRLEDYVACYPELGTPEFLPVTLIREEYRVRRRWGDRPDHAEYADRFRGRGDPLRDALSAVDVELASEADSGDESFDHESASTLRPASSPRCPHCHGLIDPIAGPGFPGSDCPHCGNTITSEAIAASTARQPPFSRVGRYALGELLGMGGFGTVWRGWDEALGREVAVKIPRGGRFSSASEEERFLREARSTAQFCHPGIVAVHDAGHDQGTVFIVSELVRGTTLAHRQALGRMDFKAAADLVAQVADALDYAHQQGVVHRDLKPSNILLDPDEPGLRSGSTRLTSGRPLGRPRIMDFGLARRVTGDVTMTLDGQFLGTPAYMSPEQISNPHKVDGRSDIYSLGVILYLLLVDELPFRGVSRMLQLQVLEDEPRPLRRFNDRIPRDLETITLRCLAKDPASRYATARELCEDLRRFLDGEPVRARPVGPAGRLLRRCRRKPLATGLVAALILACGVGSLAVGGQWLRAERHLRMAEASLLDARHAVDDYLTGVSENALFDRPGLEPLRKELLEHALKYYQGFIKSRSNDPAVLAELASAEAKVAKITAAIASQAEAILAYERAVRSYDMLRRHRPFEVDHVRGLAEVCNNLGVLEFATGRPAEARASYERARRLIEEWMGTHPRDRAIRRELAAILSNLGLLEELTGRTKEALADDERARDLFESLILEEPGVARYRSALANTYSNLGVLHYQAGRASEAQAEYERARGLQEALVRDHPDVTSYRSDLANTASNLGVLLRASGRTTEARSSYTQALDLQEALVRDHPAVKAFRAELARTLNNLGRLDQVGGRLKEALAHHEQAREIRERLVHDNPADWEARSLLGSTLNNIGLTLQDLDRPHDALNALRQGVALHREAFAASNGTVQCRQFLSVNLQDLAGLLRSQCRGAEAVSVTLERLELWPDHPGELYNSACELALCVPLIEPGRVVPGAVGPEQRLCGDQAMMALRRAVRAGFKDIAHLRKDTDLGSLRSRSDFQDFLLDFDFPSDPFAR